MAYDSRNVKYSPNTHAHQHPTRPNMTGYAYSGHPSQHFQQTDENRNENNLCGSKEHCPQISQQSSGTQTVQKVDAATMTDPLQIDFRLTSEYLARCSSTLGLPYVTKYEDSNNSTHSCQAVRPKIEFEIEPQHINGKFLQILYQVQFCACNNCVTYIYIFKIFYIYFYISHNYYTYIKYICRKKNSLFDYRQSCVMYNFLFARYADLSLSRVCI